MGERRHQPPDRAGPGNVAGAARDDMHVQLRHQVAERGDVQLVAFGDLFQGAGGAADLRHQLALFDFVEIDDLHGFMPARHQQQPGVVRILDDKHAAQRQIPDVDGIFLKL